MLETQIRNSIQTALSTLQTQGALGPETTSSPAAFQVSETKVAEHGDFATNVAMVWAKAAQKPPRVLAEAIAEVLRTQNTLFKSVEVAGPGFINLRLQAQAVQAVLPAILNEADAFGRGKPETPKKILVEFVSANPTGPIHLGHARGAFMGDALCRLLRTAGHAVTAEFYINDVGNQVQTLGRSVYLRYKELFGEAIQLGKGEYPGAYIIDIAKTLVARDQDKWLHKPEAEAIAHCTKVAIEENLKNIKATLEKANIRFDSWYSEKTLHDRHLPEALIQEYREKGQVYEADCAEGSEAKVRRDDSKAAQYTERQQGGLFLRTSQFGDEEDRILLRKSGEPVYLVADLAYHREKFDRGFDLIIDVWGADHANHAQRLKAGMAALGLNAGKLGFVTVQIVRLLRSGQEVRFSKRSGEVEELSDLLDDVGSDVARFVFLMRAANTQFDFDLDQAVKKSSDNPVFYVQYGHARMATLLARAKSEGVLFSGAEDLTPAVLSRLSLPEELSMIRKAASFPDVVQGAANALEPHRVLYFCQDLIAAFHSYFTKYRHSERIISDDAELTKARLAMVAALKQTLFNALNMLGIAAPESMHYDDAASEDNDALSH